METQTPCRTVESGASGTNSMAPTDKSVSEEMKTARSSENVPTSRPQQFSASGERGAEEFTSTRKGKAAIENDALNVTDTGESKIKKMTAVAESDALNVIDTGESKIKKMAAVAENDALNVTDTGESKIKKMTAVAENDAPNVTGTGESKIKKMMAVDESDAPNAMGIGTDKGIVSGFERSHNIPVDQTMPTSLEDKSHVLDDSAESDFEMVEHDEVQGAIMETDKTDTTMMKTDKTDTTMMKTDKTDTTMMKTDKTDATMMKTDKTVATMMETDKTDATMMETDKTDTTMMETDKTGATMIKTDKTDATMMKADKTDATMMKTDKTDATMMETDKTDATMMKTDKTDATMMKTEKTDATMMKTEKTDATMMEKDKTDATMLEKDEANAKRMGMDKTDTTDHCVLIVGKSGSGKSTVGNIITMEEKFAVAHGLCPVTQEEQSSYATVLGKRIKVVDTPDLNDADTVKQVERWKAMTVTATVPYTVLYTVRCDTQYSSDECSLYQKIKKHWGNDTEFCQHLVVAFTFGDILCQHPDQELTELFPGLKIVLTDAGNRFVIFNSKANSDGRKNQVETFLKLLHELCLLIIGKTGNGKSSLGNTITGNKKSFVVTRGMRSGTTEASVVSVDVSGKWLKVMDTPDLSNLDISKEEKIQQITEWRSKMQQMPDAILLAVRCDVRYTKEEYDIYREIKKLWNNDSEFCRRLIVTFTFGDCQDVSLDKELKGVCQELQEVLKDAANRYVLFDNKAKTAEKEKAVKQLLAEAESIRKESQAAQREIPVSNERKFQRAY